MATTTFFQDPPRPPDGSGQDALLRELLARAFGPAVEELVPELRALAALAAGPLLAQQLEERAAGARARAVGRVGPAGGPRSSSRRSGARPPALAARHGLVAAAYERRHGARSRLHQFALVHLLEPSIDVYACPLAMTDGAARTLLERGNRRWSSARCRASPPAIRRGRGRAGSG